ncbi:MAG: hypothetical protein ACI9VR_004262 [Cognaticolwellia sp.]|jgi:hypothetical protein
MLIFISLLACTHEPAEATIIEPSNTTRIGSDAAVAVGPQQRRLADGRLPLKVGKVTELPAALKADLDPSLHQTMLTISNQSYGACASCIDEGLSAADCYAECPVQPKVSGLAGQLLAQGAPDEIVLNSFNFKQGWVEFPELLGPVVQGKDHKGSPVTLWVVMDYESPFAADSWQAALDMQTQHPELNIRPLFWHPDRHQSASIAARSAMAAEAQGKFSEFNALLLAPGAALDRMSLIVMAESLGLDMAAFRAGLVDSPLRDRAQSHVNAGQKVGVRGLPCFFVNGWRMRGVPQPEQLARLVALEMTP